MIKKKEEIETIEEKVEEKQVEIPQNKGRQEDYFFPDERITIKASSMEEALKKLKGLNK